MGSGESMSIQSELSQLADNLRRIYRKSDKMTIADMVELTNFHFKKTEIIPKTAVSGWESYTTQVALPRHNDINISVYVSFQTINSHDTNWGVYLETDGNQQSKHSEVVTNHKGYANNDLRVDIPASDRNDYTKLVIMGDNRGSMVSNLSAYVDVTPLGGGS